MSLTGGWFRRHAKSLVALVPITGLYWLARPAELPGDARAALAQRFRFTPLALPQIPGKPLRTVRAVNPSLRRISAWISSVGAGVALNDLDGDGLPNDLAYVDTRTDQVIVAPAPGTPARYPRFALDPAPLTYDPDTMAPMGCLPGDFDEDGRPDLLVYYWGRTPVLFLRRSAGLHPGAFARKELVSPVERWFTNAATQADLDGDGHVDLIIGNYFPDGARILDARATNVESMQHSMSRAFNGGRSRMLLWTGPARFRDEEAALEPEVAHGWTLSVGAADLDGDLLPEVYLGHDFGPDRLLHNRSTPGKLRFARLEGTQGFATPRSKVLGRDSFKGMGVDFGDLNGDGRLDIYVSNITVPYALQESQFAFVSTGDVGQMRRGVAPYVDRSEPLGLSRSGWCWESRLADFDNDGTPEALQATGFVKGTTNRWPELQELAMGNDEFLSRLESWPRFQPGTDLSGHPHNPFFVRAADGRYYDLAPEIGIADAQVSRGIAVADVDGDGDLDFAVANQWEPSRLYRNDSPKRNAFLDLRLRLPTAGGRSRDAIGATARVFLPDGRRLVGFVDGGSGHSGKRSPEVHFGLGPLDPAVTLRVELRWRGPDGRVHQAARRLLPGRHTIALERSPA